MSNPNVNPITTTKGMKKIMWKSIGNGFVFLTGYIMNSVFEYKKYSPDTLSNNLNLTGLILFFIGGMLQLLLFLNIAITMWKHDR